MLPLRMLQRGPKDVLRRQPLVLSRRFSAAPHLRSSHMSGASRSPPVKFGTYESLAAQESGKSDWWYVGIGSAVFVFGFLPAYIISELKSDPETQQWFDRNMPQVRQFLEQYITIDEGVSPYYKDTERVSGGKNYRRPSSYSPTVGQSRFVLSCPYFCDLCFISACVVCFVLHPVLDKLSMFLLLAELEVIAILASGEKRVVTVPANATVKDIEETIGQRVLEVRDSIDDETDEALTLRVLAMKPVHRLILAVNNRMHEARRALKTMKETLKESSAKAATAEDKEVEKQRARMVDRFEKAVDLIARKNDEALDSSGVAGRKKRSAFASWFGF